ncbi:MAG TPA: hypothetical protein VNM92_16560 [Thermoanaerobaculia bacterium]|nr:hypothetical protein [Thermoanaerobaculia bacterium]
MKERLNALLARIATRGDLEREISHFGNASGPDYDESVLAILNYANAPDASILKHGSFSQDDAALIEDFAKAVSKRINH